MGKYFIKICLVCFLILSASCRKKVKDIALSKGDNVVKTFKPQSIDGALSDFTKTLDKSFINKLSKHLDNNKPLEDLLIENKSALKTWKILSSSNYGKDVEIIKYFNDLPTEKFSLKSNKGIPEIWDSKNEKLLAQISDNAIIIKRLKENPFLNLSKFVPNSTYSLNNLNYHIDELGRVSNVKSSLLKLENTRIGSTDNFGHIMSSKFGGLDFEINKTFVSDDAFKELNTIWELAVKGRKKISQVDIIPIYTLDSKIPHAFNVTYYEGKDRLIKHIPNGLKKEYGNIFNRLKAPAIGRRIDGRVATKAFPKDVTLFGDKLIYKGKDFGKIDLRSKTIHVDRRAALKGNINPFLAHPKLLENFRYVVKDGRNRHIYKTDKLGRVSESEHHVKEIYSKTRNPSQQNNAKLFGDEKSSKTTLEGLTNTEHERLSDQGGHILADAAGGIPELMNIVSQAFKVNNSRKLGTMEREIVAAVKNRDNIVVKSLIHYDGNTRRPSGFAYDIIVNGKSVKFNFDNVNHTLEVLNK